MNRFSYGHLLTLIILALLVPVSATGQTGGTSVRLTGTVSEAVTLSISPVLPNSTDSHVDMDVVSNGNTVRLTLSGTGANSSVVRVRLLVRSNTGFKITANAESETALLSQISVTDVRATGNLVSPDAVDNLVKSTIDSRGLEDKMFLERGSLIHDGSDPLLSLSGPRVSLGGTLNSPNNALQITLLIRIKPKSVGDWLAHLTFFNH